MLLKHLDQMHQRYLNINFAVDSWNLFLLRGHIIYKVNFSGIPRLSSEVLCESGKHFLFRSRIKICGSSEDLFVSDRSLKTVMQ